MTDRFVIRVVVIGLAVAVLGGLVGVVFLAAMETAIPELLGYIITTALGALGGILARTSSEPVPVTVQQPHGDPVPVEPQ